VAEDEAFGDQFDVETLVRRIRSTDEAAIRQSRILRHALAVDAKTFAAHVQEILRRSVCGDVDAMLVLIAFVAFVASPDERGLLALEAVAIEARAENCPGTAWLLLDPPPARVVERMPALRADGRPMSLGERRALAAGWDRRRLEWLLQDSDPMVIDRLCQNPRIEEQHVLTILTRRPNTPEIIARVASSPRWNVRRSVREAIVRNPYAGTGLSLRTLPLLPQQSVEQVHFSGELHPAVRMFARYLLELREGRQSGPSPDDLGPALN
jgi:hypothetical protein